MDVQKNNSTIRLLIISNQFRPLDKLLSALRNQGLELKAVGVNSKSELLEQLTLQSWDLVLCCEDADIQPGPVRKLLAEQAQDIPLIFLHDPETHLSAENLFNPDVQDSIPLNEYEHILFSIKRELAISSLKKAHRVLSVDFRELERRHQSLLENFNQPLAYILEGMHLYCNRGYADFFSASDAASMQQTPLLDLFKGKARDKLRSFLGSNIEEQQSISLPCSSDPDNNEAEAQEVELQFSPVDIDGQACLQLILRAGGGNNEYKEEVKAAGSRDLLTRLFKQPYFEEKINQAIAHAVKQQKPSCLLIVQLNEFLDIKSTIGVGKANLVLADISRFLLQSVHKKFAAARLDDYEFGLLLEDCSPLEALRLAEFIQSKINNHITTASLPSLQLSCSIGIAAINSYSLDAGDSIARARANLNTKVRGATLEREPGNEDADDDDVSLISASLDSAIRENRFRLLFQPLVSLKGDAFRTYEVLSRMLDAEAHEITPDIYIPLANLNGMGEALDKSIVSQALDELSRGTGNSLRLTLSLTSNTLLSSTFLPWLSETLHSHRITSEQIIFQLSETQICNSPEYCIQFCQGLEQLGIQRIVSHFGCVPEPADYLDAVLPHFVKLDKALVRDIDYSQYHQDELKRMIKSLHDSNCQVIIPQVEDHGVLPLLWKLGVDYVQGYSLERPRQTMDYQFVQNHELTLQPPPRNS